jgi:tetratricopeptide (TPR) repeat protein
MEQCGAPCDQAREAAERGWAEGGAMGALRARLEPASRTDWAGVPGTLYFQLAGAYTELGDKDEAFAWLERAHRERAPFLLLLKQGGRFDPLRSDPRFDDLLRRIGYPEIAEDPRERAGVGWALAIEGRSAEAIASLERAIQLSPTDPGLARWLYYMAMAHFASDRYEQATTWAERALEHNPGNYTTADAHLILAASYAQLGRTERARESLNEALGLWPDLEPDFVPLPRYVDPGLRDRYVDGLRKAGLEG